MRISLDVVQISFGYSWTELDITSYIVGYRRMLVRDRRMSSDIVRMSADIWISSDIARYQRISSPTAVYCWVWADIVRCRQKTALAMSQPFHALLLSQERAKLKKTGQLCNANVSATLPPNVSSALMGVGRTSSCNGSHGSDAHPTDVGHPVKRWTDQF